MQLWFSRGAKVSLREQLITQIILGILCNDLAPGERLPSTRELARRFRLHPNTVSAGYRQLERDGWVAFRHGSGIYVRERKSDEPLPRDAVLDRLVADLFRGARELGAPLGTVRSRLRYWLELQPPDHFLLIEPDEELRRIAVHEMQQSLTWPVKSCGLGDSGFLEALEGAVPVVFPRNAVAVRKMIPAATDLITLTIRSVPSSLSGWLPTPPGVLVGIASRWPDFLKSARTMLLAAGFHEDALLFRDARRARWHRGLNQAAAVICDCLTAVELPKALRRIIFPLVSDSSLAELKQHQEFVRNPLVSSL